MAIIQAYYNLIPITLLQGVIYAFVALGIMIPFRLLSFPDLTAEGSFPLGASVTAACLAAGFGPVSATAACHRRIVVGCVVAQEGVVRTPVAHI